MPEFRVYHKEGYGKKMAIYLYSRNAIEIIDKLLVESFDNPKSTLTREQEEEVKKLIKRFQGEVVKLDNLP